MTDTNEVEQSSWNLSQYIIDSIGHLLQSASLNYRQGRINKCYFDFQEIALLINTDLNEEESKKIEDLNKKIGVLLQFLDKEDYGSMTAEDKREILLKRNECSSNIRQYRLYIMSLLGKYGYLVQKKQDSSKMF